MTSENNFPYYSRTTLYILLVIIVIFFIIFIFMSNHYERKNIQSAYTNGSINAQLQVNNEIVQGLINYGEFRGQVYYKNQTVPIVCKVAEGQR